MKPLQIAMMAMLITSQSFAQDFEDSPFGAHGAFSRPFLTDDVSPQEVLKMISELKDPYKHVQDVEIKWVRPGIDIYWSLVQPTPEHVENRLYDWSVVDNLYGCVPYGVGVLANICAGQGIKSGTWEFVNKEVEEHYIQFVKEVVERYDGDGIDDMPNLRNPIKYWQIENEPALFYGLRLDWQGFSHLVEITHNAIEEMDPEARIALGGLAGGNEVNNIDSPFFPLFRKQVDEFYLPLLSHFQGKFIDIFDIHFYFDFTDWPNSCEDNWRDMKDIYNIIRTALDQNGYKNADIWFTETAMPTKPYGEKAQAIALIKRFIFPLSFGVKKIFWWNMIEGEYPLADDQPSDHFGLIYDGIGTNDPGYEVKKLSYYSYKRMVDKLEGSSWDSVQTLMEGDDNVYVYKVNKVEIDEPVYVVWWEWFDDSTYVEGDSMVVVLTVQDIDSVGITEAIPDAESGADLNEEDYPAFFATVTKQVVDGTVTITLGENPVFVEGLSFTTSVEEETGSLVPRDFKLEQNYPNPFNPITAIQYQLPKGGRATLVVYNLLGQEVVTLVNKNQAAGRYSVNWDGKDHFREKVTGGIYFYQMRTKDFVQTKKLLFLK